MGNVDDIDWSNFSVEVAYENGFGYWKYFDAVKLEMDLSYE